MIVQGRSAPATLAIPWGQRAPRALRLLVDASGKAAATRSARPFLSSPDRVRNRSLWKRGAGACTVAWSWVGSRAGLRRRKLSGFWPRCSPSAPWSMQRSGTGHPRSSLPCWRSPSICAPGPAGRVSALIRGRGRRGSCRRWPGLVPLIDSSGRCSFRARSTQTGLTRRSILSRLSGRKILEARGIRPTSSHVGTPSQPPVGMSKPAEVDRFGRPEPAERKAEGARLGCFHSEPPAAVLQRRARHAAIGLIPFLGHELWRKG